MSEKGTRLSIVNPSLDTATKSASSSTQGMIADLVKNHRVVLFLKGTPESPMCGFSHRAATVLQAYPTAFHAVNVLESEELRQGIKEFSDWPTIPQLYIDGTFIGGSDILIAMHESGELKKLLVPV